MSHAQHLHRPECAGPVFPGRLYGQHRAVAPAPSLPGWRAAWACECVLCGRPSVRAETELRAGRVWTCRCSLARVISVATWAAMARRERRAA